MTTAVDGFQWFNSVFKLNLWQCTQKEDSFPNGFQKFTGTLLYNRSGANFCLAVTTTRRHKKHIAKKSKLSNLEKQAFNEPTISDIQTLLLMVASCQVP